MPRERIEITDLLWSLDRDGGRLPVMQAEVLQRLRASRQRAATRIVRRLPAEDGVLDPDRIDELGLRVHRELQRLGEELQFGGRVAALIGPLVTDLATSGPVRVVDVGCGLGYLIRWLAAQSDLGRGDRASRIELVGVDRNAALIAEASRLTRQERLRCRFVQGDAFTPGAVIEPAVPTVVVSSGLLHHLPAPELARFFGAQRDLGVFAFAHWDIAPCFWSTLGAWVFHQARMREPVSRHDGVLSARRAHSAEVLLAAAGQGAPGYRVRVDEGSRWHPRALDVLRPVVGIRT